MEEIVLGEFWEITLFYEENLFGGIGNGGFLMVCSGSHVVLLRRGDNAVHLEEFNLGLGCGWGV
jgi:hypothetical protein